MRETSPRLIIVLSAILMTGCAQPFSELQSARLVGDGKMEVTGSYSAVSFSGGGNSSAVQDDVGVQIAGGIADGVDLRVRWERLAPVNDRGSAVMVVGLGPKFQLTEDRVALYVPTGFAFGGDIETSHTWEVHPTLLLTRMLHRNVELNGSGKLLIPVSDMDREVLAAVNFGMGVSSNLDRWALRPEFGFMINPGEEGSFRHVSLGLTFYVDQAEK